MNYPELLVTMSALSLEGSRARVEFLKLVMMADD